LSLRQDVTFAARLLRRNPVFTATAVLSLAIGIAANAAIFSLADALLLRGRPGIADPDQLVDVARSQDGEGFDNMSYPNYLDFRDRNTVFAGLAAHRMEAGPFGLGSGDGAERVFGTAVSGNYFDVLGVRMAQGRGFRPEEDRLGGDSAVAVVSFGLWRHRFAADASVVGRTIRLNGRPFTVVGVAPEGFAGSSFVAPDLWIPLTAYPAATGRTAELLTNRAAVWLVCVGRLRPGVTLEQARAQMTAIARDLEKAYPDENRGKGAAIAASARIPGDLRPMVAGFIGLLFALVGLVLLIACANVAGMLLARAAARAREIAVRLAVGAGRQRIVRQLVTESVLLSLIGGGAGVLGAVWSIQALRGLIPVLPMPVSVELRLDWRVVAFSVALALATGVLFGLAPALQAARTDLVATLKGEGASSSWTPRRLRLRQGFVVVQVSMSVLLVVCALILTRSLRHTVAIDPGFTAEDVDVVEVDLRLAGLDRTAGLQFAEQLLERVHQLPGVRSAALARVVPLAGNGLGMGRVRVPGDGSERDRIRPDWNLVTPRYFETLQIALVRGRAFTAEDRAGRPDAAIVNETFARRAWPGEDPIGKTLLHDDDGGPRELHVVGLAKDGKYRSLDEAPRAFIWVPLAQQYGAGLSLLVRRDGGTAIPATRALLRQMEPNLPVVSAASLLDVTALGLLPQRLAAWTAGSFGLVGLLLASIGVYGLTAYSVTQRTREIGVRVALGAARRDVLRLVIGQAMRLASAGAVAGLLAAAAATRLLASLLVGVRPLDPPSFLGGAALFGVLALVASWLPARRAARVNPVEALRAE
jgi:predicted permease